MAELDDSHPTSSKASNCPMRTQNVKLRRRVTAEDRTEETTSIQRLVEYFVVVSSQPRWENNGSTIPKVDPSIKQFSPRIGKKKGMAAKPSIRQQIVCHPVDEPESRDNQETVADDDGGNIHMPRSAFEYTFKPAITARFPEVDYPDNPLNPMIVQFCFPHSDSIVPSTTYVLPRIHHFVLTNEKGRKIYGTCLTVYEEYLSSGDEPFGQNNKVHENTGVDDIEVTMDSAKGATLYVPRVLSLISYWSYLTAFREYLTQLYRLATTTDLMRAPLERYILNICLEIPAPPPGAFEVHINILQSTIKFWAPPAKLPIAYVALPYQTLFDCLEINNILLVWYALVMEQKILLISSQYSILTICSEILCSLLFPMQWSHLYIPMLPKFLSPMLDAPIPYLVGLIRENLMYAEEHISAETIIVDLDSNKVTLGQKTPKLSTPPLRKWNKLQAAVEENAGELFWKTRCLDAEYQMVLKGKMTPQSFRIMYDVKGNTGWKEKLKGFDDAFSMAYLPDSVHAAHAEDNDAQSRWDKVQEAFLRFFVSTLKTYRKFLHVPEANGTETSDVKPGRWTSSHMTFDRSGFIAWQKSDQQPFFQEMCMTQQFDDFITKRMYNPDDADVIFFDQSIDAKDNRSRLKLKKVETPFLQSAKAHKVLKTLRAVEPNEDCLRIKEFEVETQQQAYRYEIWPDSFDSSLFGEPRPIPKIITAEFDRQASLVQRLQSKQYCGVDPSAALIEFYGADYDPSPEVATFTVFFFCYGAVVGLEWQDYHERERKLEELKACEIAEHHTGKAEQGGQGDKPRDFPATEGPSPGPYDEEKKEESASPADKRWHPCSESEMATMHAEISSLVLDCSHQVCPQDNEGNSDVFLMKYSHSGSGFPKNDSRQGRDVSLLDFFDDGLAAFEEARAVSTAQLDLAFDSLSTMSIRGLSTDADAFKSLMEACARCGSTDRAKQLIQIMKRDGFVADSEIYSCFMTAFAQDESLLGMPSQGASGGVSHGKLDAYSSFLTKKVEQFKSNTSLTEKDDEMSHSVVNSFDDSETSSAKGSSLIFNLYSAVFSPIIQKKAPKERKAKKNRNRSFGSPRKVGMAVPASVLKQVVLGESLLDYLYPDIHIDTSNDSCPHCSNILSDDEVVKGWNPCGFEDFTTQCPQCKHRFVPHLTVTTSSPTFEGSQGKGTPLYCEMLSPWVLRKELDHVIHGSDGVKGMLNPAWRDGTNIQATIWWNLICAFNRYRLPVSFLLQGSFQNRLILPTPDT